MVNATEDYTGSISAQKGGRNLPNARLQSIEPIGARDDSKSRSPMKHEMQKRLTNRNGQFLMQ